MSNSNEKFAYTFSNLARFIDNAEKGILGPSGYELMREWLSDLVRLHNEQVEALEDERITREHAEWVASTSEGWE